MHTVGPRRSEPRRLALGALALTTMTLALGLGFTPPASAQITGVVLFADINYGGANRTFGVGSYSNIGSDWNDRASSIAVPLGMVVSVYENGAFGGRCENFTINDNDLRDNPIGQDSITSLKVGQPCPARLWDDPNYGGSFVQFVTDIPDLGAYGMSDRGESLQVTPGTRVSLYDLPNYGGVCESFTADDTNFENNPIRQRASSLRLNVDCPKQAILFEDIYYGGAYFSVPVNPYYTSGIGFMLDDAWKDRASSVYLTGGAILDVANHYTYRVIYQGLLPGLSCQRFFGSVSDLRSTLIGNDGIDAVAAFANGFFLDANRACIDA